MLLYQILNVKPIAPCGVITQKTLHLGFISGADAQPSVKYVGPSYKTFYLCVQKQAQKIFTPLPRINFWNLPLYCFVFSESYTKTTFYDVPHA